MFSKKFACSQATLLHHCGSSAIARAAAAIPAEPENSSVAVQHSTRLAEPVLCVQVELIDRLLDVTPPSLTRFFFANSGSEVVENAVKLARGHTKRTNVISFDVRVLLGLQNGHCARPQVICGVQSQIHCLHAVYSGRVKPCTWV